MGDLVMSNRATTVCIGLCCASDRLFTSTVDPREIIAFGEPREGRVRKLGRLKAQHGTRVNSEAVYGGQIPPTRLKLGAVPIVHVVSWNDHELGRIRRLTCEHLRHERHCDETFDPSEHWHEDSTMPGAVVWKDARASAHSAYHELCSENTIKEPSWV